MSASIVLAAAREGRLGVGTVDAWLTARLGDRGPLTDPSTASRTQLMSLASGAWDDELLAWFGLDRTTLPRIVPTVGDAGALDHPRWGGPVPLVALACDQQAALAGHGAFEPGAIKATYGTGVFVLANGGQRIDPVEGLETSVAWDIPGQGRASALQGGVFAAGALLDWLRDGLGAVAGPSDTEAAARRANGGHVRFLPALAGLGAPFYDHHAQGVVAGLTAATTLDQIVRAALDGIAQRTTDVVEAIGQATGLVPDSVRVDGGLVRNGYLMERQADLLGIPIDIASAEESTALGIAGLAAIGTGLATRVTIVQANPARRRVEPCLGAADREMERSEWRAFVEATRRL